MLSNTFAGHFSCIDIPDHFSRFGFDFKVFRFGLVRTREWLFLVCIVEKGYKLNDGRFTLPKLSGFY